ncbi:FAD-dependent oxidoreductase [Leptolyngbya sp. FACHB-36]|uniref:FAD-dependent oxidoreductase n=1 Tax=Leptolyngbya sp. FACHB-36 TaxID=2692808 RepID=UPI0016808159|nr:FAD-dependent oxidoreductase [Leptolyngbya sp. FACHB-36]MBD2022039.1 FAD-dependent oxidoreductase [Leptolyngbya sp. FACHB-36]
MSTQPIVVIGGGFYGCSVAEYLAQQGAEVVLLERAADLLTRASYSNQARLHGGYHYPRSFSTAYRSRLNFERFLREYRPAIADCFTKLYAIARIGSKVSPHQFEFFCRNIDAPLVPASSKLTKLFSPRLISAVYETQEYAFDAAVLRRLLVERLVQSGVKLQLNTTVAAVQSQADGNLAVLDDRGNCHTASYVFNCTYAGLNTIAGILPTRSNLKHEITELALVQLPTELENVSVTVMDGPFFSFMPFPDRGLSTFTHVRYTPHASWLESPESLNAYQVLAAAEARSNFGYMVRDAQRYMPCLNDTRYCDSLFEVKTVLVKNEGDDGRPILFEVDAQQPKIVSMLGSKIDNIYDALAAVQSYFDRP